MFLAVLVALYAPSAHADDCAYIMVSVDIIWVGGYPIVVPNYELFCSIDVGGSGGDPGGGGTTGGNDGGGVPQEPPPSLELTSVSDQDPKNYLVGLNLANTDVLTVFVNGFLVNTFYDSPGFVLMGSLDNVPSGTNEIAFRAENSVGTITRSFTALRAPQDYYSGRTVNIGYQYLLGEPLSSYSDTYQRILTVNALYTSYSLSTAGRRNGRVEHEYVTDEMDLITTTWYQAPSSLTWSSTYSMTDVDFSDAVSLGECGLFSHCGDIRKFAIEGYPNGSGRMGAVTSTAAGVLGIAIPIGLDILLDP